MKILLVTQYFWPESFIINDVVRELINQGHEVLVVTGKPNYPDGQVFPGYQAGGIQHDLFEETVEVLRVPLWPRGKGGAKNLLLNYFSFVLAGLVFSPWLLRNRDVDVIFVFAPSPITQVIPAIPLKWFKKARLAVWVQDLWPESLSATGFVKQSYLLRGVGQLVKAIYAHCDTLLVPSRAFVEPVGRYTSRDKIVYYPNSIDVQSPSSAEAELPADLLVELEKNFCVVFAGNLGTAQSLETVVETAKKLEEYDGIRLVLVGSGSRLAWLQEQKALHQLHNLLLPGRFPIETMPRIFARAGALLVSLKDEAIFAQTIPSKIQAYLAAGRPIIASLRGEGAHVVIEAGAGRACEPEDPAALAALIYTMKNLPAAELQAMGEAGKAYFYEHFEMRSQVTRLVEILDTQRKEH